MAKRILTGEASQQAILRGVDGLAEAVKVTLGPLGRNVILGRRFGLPRITKDGVTVAKEIELQDRLENVGVQALREVAAKTAAEAGDGTTTATVLAQALYRHGLRNVAAGSNPMEVKRGLERAADAVASRLASLSRPVSGDAVVHVATLSANGDEVLGRIVGQTIQNVGKDGVISVEEGQGLDTSVEVVEGMQFESGYLSPHFVTDSEHLRIRFEGAAILIHEKKLGSARDLLPLLEQVSASGLPLLVIAEEVEGEALATLVVNTLRGTFKAAAVKAPGFGDQRKALLEDIAILTRARAITEDLGVRLETLKFAELGSAKSVTIEKDRTTIVGGAGDPAAIEARIQQLRAQAAESTSDYDREKLKERLAKLAGGVAVIRVGAATETEMKEKKARAEDAVHATRAAVEEGIVPGGGVALLRAARALDELHLGGDQQVGIDVLRRAVEEPLRCIAANAGYSGTIVVEKVRGLADDWGFNAVSGTYEDLVAAGIVDPTKVVRSALLNATSIASLLLTTEVSIGEEPEPSRAGAA